MRTGHGIANLSAHDEEAERCFSKDVANEPEPGGTAFALWPRATRLPTPLVRVLLCEDQEVFRLGLRVIFETEPDMAVVAEVSHFVEALDVVNGPGTQVVVVRQALVGHASLPLLQDLCQRGTRVLMLAETRSRSDLQLLDALQAGVRGCLPRRSAAQPLVDAVRSLARQGIALDSSVASQLVRHLTDGSVPTGAQGQALDRLTERQRDVALLVAEGLSNGEIAGRLFLSPATVKSHLTAVLRRLDIRTRTQLAILVHRDHSPAA